MLALCDIRWSSSKSRSINSKIALTSYVQVHVLEFGIVNCVLTETRLSQPKPHQWCSAPKSFKGGQSQAKCGVYWGGVCIGQEKGIRPGQVTSPSPIHHRAHKPFTHTLLPRDNLGSPIYPTSISLDCGRKPESVYVHNTIFFTNLFPLLYCL